MDSPNWAEKAIEELIKGKDNLINLMKLLHEEKPPNIIFSHDSVSAEDLFAGISKSFEYAIHMLSSGAGQSSLGGISSVTLEEHRSVDSTDSSRRTAVKRDRRGCYKRRKQSNSSNLSPTMEDGYAWRKYGQKMIHDHTFPRCYFKCTHKSSAGCKATKQVQKWEKDQTLYQTTYFGEHTCSKRAISSSQISIKEQDHHDDPYIVDFDSSATPISEEMEDHPLMDKNDVVIKEGTDSELPEQLMDMMMWSDLATFDYEDVSSVYNLLHYGVDIDIDNDHLFLI